MQKDKLIVYEVLRNQYQAQKYYPRTLLKFFSFFFVICTQYVQSKTTRNVVGSPFEACGNTFQIKTIK